MPERSVAIGVLGMHRSGTSALTKCLGASGIYLGEEEAFMPASEANEAGYWEIAEIVEEHDALLEKLGGTWQSFVSLPEDFEPSRDFLDVQTRLEDMIQRHFGGHEIWAWKDPRVCLCLPLWRSVLEKARVSAHYLICVRSPTDVAQSLSSRDNMSVARGKWLWSLYTLKALVGSEGESRALVHFEDLIAKPVQVIEGVFERLHISEHHLGTEGLAVENSIDADLRHWEVGESNGTDTSAADRFAARVYALTVEARSSPALLDDLEFQARCRTCLGALYQHPEFPLHILEVQFGVQVFSAGEDGFSEDRSVVIATRTGHEFYRHVLTVDASPRGIYRFDPSNLRAVHDFLSIEMWRIGDSGERTQIARWSSESDFRSLDAGDDAVWSDKGPGRLFSLSNDPKLMLADPEPSTSPSRQVEIVAHFRVQPLTEYVDEALGVLRRLAATSPERVDRILWNMIGAARPDANQSQAPRSRTQRLASAIRGVLRR